MIKKYKNLPPCVSAILVITLLLTVNSSNAVASDDFENVVVATFSQIKAAMKEKSSPDKIEAGIERAIDMGAKSLRIDHYHNGDVGWTAIPTREITGFRLTIDAPILLQPQEKSYSFPLGRMESGAMRS